jgi:hypothetical protein
MIQIPFLEPPPGFIPLPLDWFQFALLYLACLELVVLAMPRRWQDRVIEVAFCLPNKPNTEAIAQRRRCRIQKRAARDAARQKKV